ncbi:MAG: D-tagatose-bisphosphate aldolase, class II, non-catalytic subunit [Chloroflexota bacterium]|nr:D-tagatose-bisphosphate aldolase, class II, non-catalytic subunit [Chloroflexota bacterium]
MSSYLDNIVAAQKAGGSIGIPSICSAHPFVVAAALHHARASDAPVLIESTCNQVNQFGGYTGMTPRDFVAYVYGMADDAGLSHDRIIIGGDHLGPNPWQDEPAVQAMDEARDLVRDCVLAGYEKIHLDASMKLADDDSSEPLSKQIAAARAADMAQVAEEAFRQSAGAGAPRYVIGTEVPIPGGAQEEEGSIRVTQPDDVAETIEITRAAFLARGLEDAWQRVIAVVVQPGVEFGDSSIYDYERMAASPLVGFIEAEPLLVYEAHSTDYQTPAALRQMVEDHFAILKVGPGLTFAFRERVFALAMIEEELLAGEKDVTLSDIRETLDEAMLADSIYWRKHYRGSPREQYFARRYSLSDRSRYYWPVPAVQAALAQLLANLEAHPIPLSLLSQYLPCQYEDVRNHLLDNSPRELILDKIRRVLADYSSASGISVSAPVSAASRARASAN